MAYPYICDACKLGDHKSCEGERDMPTPFECEQSDYGYSEVLGGGFCVCDHKALYASPDEYWNALRARDKEQA